MLATSKIVKELIEKKGNPISTAFTLQFSPSQWWLLFHYYMSPLSNAVGAYGCACNAAIHLISFGSESMLIICLRSLVEVSKEKPQKNAI